MKVNRSNLLPKILISLLALIALFLLYYQHRKLSYEFMVDTNNKHAVGAPLFQDIPLPAEGVYNHASSVVVVDDNNQQALVTWVAGTGELEPDVGIYAMRVKFGNTVTLEKATRLFDKTTIEQEETRYIRAVGNPIVVRYANKLWLFFCTVAGGWSTASINYKTSTNNGLTWSPARTLILSPTFNISKMIKTSPVFFKDGTLGLPIYKEFGDHEAELLRIDPNGHILALQRLSWDSYTLQPVIVPVTSKIAHAFMRDWYSPLRRVYIAQTLDGGKSWRDVYPSQLANPNSAIAALNIFDGYTLIALNNSPRLRSNLEFAILDKNQQPVCFIPFKATDSIGITYPYLIRSNNFYLMSYSDVGHISLLEFNQAWLEKTWQNCTKV